MANRKTRRHRSRGGSAESEKCYKNVDNDLKKGLYGAEMLLTAMSKLSKKPNVKEKVSKALKTLRSKKHLDKMRKRLTQRCKDLK